MKNKWLRMLSYVLVLCLVLSGCGAGSTDGDDRDESGEHHADVETEAEEQETEEQEDSRMQEDAEQEDSGKDREEISEQGQESQAEHSGCDISLYVHGLNVIALMEELADSEAYARMMSVSEELLGLVKEAGEGNYVGRDPKAVYEITFEPGILALVMEESKEFGELSDTVREYAYSRLTTSLFNIINARGGVNCVAAAGVSTVTKAFVCDKLEKETLYLYVYEDAFPVAVSFVTGEDHAVMAIGNFIFDEDFTVNSAEEIKACLMDCGMPVKVVEVGIK